MKLNENAQIRNQVGIIITQKQQVLSLHVKQCIAKTPKPPFSTSKQTFITKQEYYKANAQKNT